VVSYDSSPFLITLYDKDFVRQGWLGDPESLNVSVTHNGGGSATFTTGARNQKLNVLMERGARVRIAYRGEHLISGPVRAKSGKGPALDGSITFTVQDDFRLFHRILGWPAPGNAINAQTSAYHVITGPAESVLKSVVGWNAITRLGEPVTYAPDLGRGADITCSFRFHPLADLLFPKVDGAGIGATVKQDEGGLIVDCYEPSTYPRVLTEAGGNVVEWSWTSAEAEATNVVVGGAGDGTARVFNAFTDETLYGALGERIEIFKDATDTTDSGVMGQRAAEAFKETAVKDGLSVKLAETSVFRYGGEHGVHVGDRVTLTVGDGLTITDTLRTVALAWTRDAGLTVTPAIGEISNNTDRVFALKLAAVAAGVRDLRRK
jgi:hypothetical protein